MGSAGRAFRCRSYRARGRAGGGTDRSSVARGDWFSQKKTPAKRATAIRSYFRQLAEFLGRVDMTSVTAKNIVAFKKDLLKGDPTEHTVKIVLSPIKTVFKFAVREDYRETIRAGN
jgi:site-specific recombinase XerD